MFRIKILTTTTKAVNQEAYSANIHLLEGDVTVLENHIPILSLHKFGVITIKNEQNDSKPLKFIVDDGVTYIERKNVRIFSDYMFDFNEDTKETVLKEIDRLNEYKDTQNLYEKDNNDNYLEFCRKVLNYINSIKK